jgi:gamma-glutamylcyclotransferase (GGCT)/AIG2-like uncharacterized protein YtfP
MKNFSDAHLVVWRSSNIFVSLVNTSRTAMIDRLFVYGTLAPGRPNEHVLADVPGSWEPASVRGKLVDGGWGAALGFPGIVPTKTGELDQLVTGWLFSSSELHAHWARLDDFEGSGYVRVPMRATLEHGQVVTAQVYTLRLEQPMASPAS